MMHHCPLCKNKNVEFFYQDKKRAFFKCNQCQLIFSNVFTHRPPVSLQKLGSEKNAAKKQTLLTRFILSLLSQLESLSDDKLIGLNYGRVLDDSNLGLINSAGHHLSQFDPIYAPNHQLLKHDYDFICCYQVFEHFKNPNQEWHLLQRMLKPGALLAINIQLLKQAELFAKWHHKNNLNNVCFYQAKTFNHLAQKSDFTLLFATNDLILMQKPSGSVIKPDQNLFIQN